MSVQLQSYVTFIKELPRKTFEEINDSQEVKDAIAHLSSVEKRDAVFAQWFGGKITIITDSPKTTSIVLDILHKSNLMLGKEARSFTFATTYKDFASGRPLPFKDLSAQTRFSVSLAPDSGDGVTIDTLFRHIKEVFEKAQAGIPKPNFEERF